MNNASSIIEAMAIHVDACPPISTMPLMKSALYHTVSA